MNQPFFYCSELSRRASEKTFGTASVGGVWLLLEYPEGWGQKPLPDSKLPPDVKASLLMTLAKLRHSRLLFIKKERATRAGLAFYAVRCRERDPFIVKYRLDSYEQLNEIDVASAIAGRSFDGGEVVREPLFLVCTHGRRDKCCAKFGYPLYKSLRESEGEAVWQSSHVGGDRFAANLVCFPHGLFYAHMTDEAARRAADEYRARRLVLDRYRGRACYAYHIQAADYFVRAGSGMYGLDDLRYLDSRRVEEKSWVVRFASARENFIHEARVSCHPSEFQNYITCHATEEKSIPQFVLNDYRLIDEREAARD